jgi:thiol-disulfide isomerase/thioredoxin
MDIILLNPKKGNFMKKLLFFSSLTLLLLSMSACVKQDALPISPQVMEVMKPTPPPPPPPVTNQPIQTQSDLPTHNLLSVQGANIFIQEQTNGFIFPQLDNQIILLQIFGKECEYCFEEMPFIKSVSNRYASHLKVISLQAQDKMSQNESDRIIQKFQINYPIIDRDEATGLLKFINKTYGWNGILPYFLLIKDGVTEYSFSGKVDKQEFESAIQSLM